MKVACVLPSSLSKFRVMNQPDYIKISNLNNIHAKLKINGFDSQIFDLLAGDAKSIDDIFTEIKKYQPDVLVLCAHFCMEDLQAFLEKMIPILNAKPYIICYGTGVMDWKLTLNKIKCIDAVVTCYPEDAICQWLNKVEKKELDSVVEGVAVRKKTEYKLKKRTTDDLNSLVSSTPLESWISSVEPDMAFIWGSRGCWYGKCSFCNIGVMSSQYEKSGWISRDVDSIISDMKLLSVKGVRKFHFLDSEFIGSGQKGKERARCFAKKIISESLDIRFIFDCRIDNVDYETFRLLKEAGLANVFIGIESGSQTVLKRLNKGYNLDKVINSIKILRDLKIRFKTNFMLAEPEISMEEIVESLNFIKDNQLLDTLKPMGIGSVFHQMHLHAGTPIYKKEVKRLKKDEVPSEIACIYHDPKVAAFIKFARQYDKWLNEKYTMSYDTIKDKDIREGYHNYLKMIGFHGLLDISYTFLKIDAEEELLIDINKKIDYLKNQHKKLWNF